MKAMTVVWRLSNIYGHRSHHTTSWNLASQCRQSQLDLVGKSVTEHLSCKSYMFIKDQVGLKNTATINIEVVISFK